MKDGFVKSSPHFFRMIGRSLWLLIVTLLVLAALFPAPLQTVADPATTPNPAKSAWFLLWTQELVSWSRWMMYAMITLGLLFMFLPWLPGQMRSHHARWFPPGQRAVSLLTMAAFIAILVLTVVALVFRGPNWSLVF
ncbi:MAG: selenite/tellurite reduction operon b-type cytochrome membrane protein ExtQ [Desulfobacteraceae bacterium]|nr:selenite/tellurite reduction operon b-type cytochrome membrane protein ExtQ [Desulfobacteraceae bacterium]